MQRGKFLQQNGAQSVEPWNANQCYLDDQVSEGRFVAKLVLCLQTERQVSKLSVPVLKNNWPY